MNATIERIEKQQIQKSIPPFNIGDTVQVFVKVIEGDRVRTQVFEGNVIARRGRNTRETITVRKIAYGVGVERIFPIYSPVVQDIKVIRQGRVRRAKLYYLRGKKGRNMRIEEKETFGRAGAAAAKTVTETKAGTTGEE
ncbi:MAG: 50S ribosomal protein L19 [Nitrospirae bacterium]|nr:50S ribosomal protein L19 [Nitrospirota bacterium]MBI5096121.1 50S ribosomal protein L19 [Nitrospirota bacterium]